MDGKRIARGSTRQIIIVDDEPPRRSSLIDMLSAAGFSPVAPRTPLDAFDLLGRADANDLLLVAPTFKAAVADSFPEYATEAISDDLESTLAALRQR
ncbi:hypothetical protein BH11MYX2_BH11MYX2_21800 [soil metagenome]